MITGKRINIQYVIQQRRQGELKWQDTPRQPNNALPPAIQQIQEFKNCADWRFKVIERKVVVLVIEKDRYHL